MKSIMFKRIVFIIALAALPIPESFAAAGKFNFVIGDVSVVGASGSRKAVRGGEVEANESIVSGKDGMAQLRMSDGAFIAVRSDTELRIETYKFSGKADASSESVLSLVKGTFRAFTGAIASFNKDKFKMKTPSATIGIRGSGNVLNFSPVDNLTLNHTIEGSHIVTAFDPSGALRTLVTMPGQTVQINAVGAMQLVQTPTFILNAAAGVPDSKPQQQPRQQQNHQPGAGQAPGQGGAPGEGGGAAAGGPGMPGAPGMVAPGMMPRAGGMRAPGMPGMYVEGGESAGDPAMTGRAPGQPGMYNPAMPGGVPAIDPVTGMPMAPAPGMYGAAPMPGVYPPTPGMPGAYGAPMIDHTTGMPMAPAPGMYGAAPMPGMYPPAAGMPYNDPAMMGGGTPGMYGAPAPMPGMYPPAPGMPGGMYNDPAMMGGGAVGMYGAPAPIPGMYPPAPGMPGAYGAPMIDPATGMAMPPAPGMYGVPAPMPGMYPPAPGMPGGMYTDPAMMGMYAPAPMPGGMYPPAPAPGMYNPAMPTGTTYTTYNPMTGMTTTYVPPPTTYIAQYGYDAMGNLLPGYILINGIPTLQGSAPYGYQYDFYGNLVLMPGFALNVNGVPYPTGAITRYGFDANGLLMPGYVIDIYGNPYPSGAVPPYGFTYDFYGNLVLAPGFMRDANGNVVLMGATGGAIGWVGGPCAGYSAPAGAFCDFATNLWVSTGGTTVVGWLGGPCAGYNAPAGAYCDAATHTWISAGGGVFPGGACTGMGTVSGTLYCDGTTWNTPVAGTFCTGTTVVGSMACSGGFWIYTGGAVAGGMCTGAGGVSGGLYCDGVMWITPVIGSPCVGTATVAGLSCSAGWWVAQATYATPGGFPAPAGGMMYDAFGVQVPITPLLPSYKNIGYMYNLGGINSFEIALNNTATVVTDVNGGLTRFQLPPAPGTSSVNTLQLDIGTAIPLDLGMDPMTGMSWGRWSGGMVSLMIPTAPVPNTTQTGSLHWFSTGTQTQPVTLPVTGTWNYVLVGNTQPTDNANTVGVLNGASFSANFSAQTVNVNLNASMPASPVTAAMPVTLNASALNVPILAGGNFKTNAPTVTCAGAGCAAPTGSGVIGGQFSAPTGNGVGVGYGLVNGIQTVNGVVVFRK